ncbi:DUF349 domain-containing protein [Pontimicrobium aquaticum]|uniref:DUF349 domain-containing protein n=1 Tax=Pontimicrobium aquaticum TaxID=2565367 RepID=A0A4U0EWR8_9FLAO|nr:DUF349 domain-containing protein [Pontimicrobium aquaticum]TJY36300.1 DUF349 domain-containing protein [Pontimicrobium aquaticum]
MSEKDNLQEADGIREEITTQPEDATKVADTDLVADTNTNVEREEKTEVTEEASKETPSKEADADEVQEEIDASNAEDAEDEENTKRHDIEEKDYHAMSLDALVDELEHLVKNEKIQTIKSHFETIKNEFNTKFSTLLEEKKEEFIAGGGNSIDFHFKNPAKTRFNEIYREYRDKRQDYYKNLEKNLKANLEQRLQIIEEIKGLINVEENINTTYKHFKELQESWRNAGPIPRDKYNNVWNNYHHHVEIFYDFLHLNRDLRDLDFKHNLEQKLKIIDRAEELAKDTDSNRAFRELQALHKIWKEELGPVDKEHREAIWERFSAATKAIHEKRQAYFEELNKAYEKNLEKKHEIIAKIDAIAEDESNNHGAWQKKIKAIEALREEFFKAGKVPIKVNEETWAKFKNSVRTFNRNKNAFYKSLKKDQYENLQKKLELIKIAEDNKDSEDFNTTTPLMKKIQSDWKKIGHVPRKDSDKIWKQFKNACNHFFDRYHENKNAANKEEVEALDKKTKFLEDIQSLTLTDNVDESLAIINSKIETWKTIGRVPYNKRFIDGKFNKAIDALYGKLNLDKAKTELLKYDNKLMTISNDKRSLDNEHNFVRKKIGDIKGEINQLENNLQFFSNVEDDNPLVKDVHKNIDKYKTELETWKAKLKKIKQYY